MFSSRSRTSTHTVACFLAAALLAGCAAKSPTVAPTVPAQAKAAGASACEQFTNRLCAELGAKTEACMSLRSVREWFPEKACEVALSDMEGSLARVRSLRGDCDKLAQKICGELGDQSPVCEEVKHDLPEVPVGQCRMLLSHYPELIAQLRTREQRTQPLSPEAWS